MSLIRLLAPFLLTIALWQPSLLAGSTSLPLVIVVRDGQGNPLAGLTLRLLLAGPPAEPFDNCATDGQGRCRLMIPPGSYIVQFEGGGWGHYFIPADQQNAGDGTTGGGFGIYFEPSGQEQVVTFVVGRRDGQLVPLWDMSRDPSAPPQPYALPENPFSTSGDPLAGIDLSPLAASATEGAQVVESTIGVGATSTPLPTVISTPAILPNGGIPADGLRLGVIALMFIAALVVAVVLVAARLRRQGAR